MPLINWWTRSARGRVGDGRAKGEKRASYELGVADRIFQPLKAIVGVIPITSAMRFSISGQYC
jgi:hypothetical protein